MKESSPSLQQPPPNVKQPSPNIQQPPNLLPNIKQNPSPPVHIQKPPPNLSKANHMQMRGSGDFLFSKNVTPNALQNSPQESPLSFSPLMSDFSAANDSDSTDDSMPPLESIDIDGNDTSKKYRTNQYYNRINQNILNSPRISSESEEIDSVNESTDDQELAIDDNLDNENDFEDEDNDLTLAPESPTLPQLVPNVQTSSSAASSVPSSFSDNCASNQPLPDLEKRPTHDFHETARLNAANNQMTHPRPFIEPVGMYDADISELLGSSANRGTKEYSSLSYFTQALNSTLSKTSTGSTDNQNSSSDGSYSSTSPTDDHPQKQVGVTDWSAAFGFKGFPIIIIFKCYKLFNLNVIDY